MPGLAKRKPKEFPRFFKNGFWFLTTIPILLGACYLLIAFPRFCDDPSFILEHLLVLALWITNTVILMAVFQNFPFLHKGGF